LIVPTQSPMPSDRIAIAVDTLGGDFPLEVPIAGALRAARKGGFSLVLVGPQERVEQTLARHDVTDLTIEIVDAPDQVGMDELPTRAIRKRNSSMRRTIDLVREGKVDGGISGGNTGALMAMGTLFLRTIPGIDRPAIASRVPRIGGSTLLLDMGANVVCSAENLVQFAIMGDVFARVINKRENPAIGLLNIGSEEIKGTDTVKQAGEILSKLPLNFVGNVEGNDIYLSDVDVVVTDGFTGNVALKTSEGVAKMITTLLKEALLSTTRSKIGALLVKPALDIMKEQVNPDRYNGALLLGLSGVLVKSHGGAGLDAFTNATMTAFELAKGRVVTEIEEEISHMAGGMSAAQDEPASED